MALHGCQREGSSSRPAPPQGLEQQRHASTRTQEQRWLGMKWESRALANALCRSVLLTCAQALPAEIRKCPGDGDVDTFLGVKGSPVQIRPSRLVIAFFRKYFCPRPSQQKSHSFVKWPFWRHAPIVCPGLLPGHLSKRQSRRNRPSRGQRSLSHLRATQRPRQLRTRRHHLRRTCSPQAGRQRQACPPPPQTRWLLA